MVRFPRIRCAVWGLVFATLLLSDNRLRADEPALPLLSGQTTVTFDLDVQPLLTRFGCNSGPCHGKSRGQNGFALSLLGFDGDFDYESLVREGRGRRVSLTAPAESLLLQKAVGQVPHGGGARFTVDSPHYQLLKAWVEAGAPRTPPDAPQLVRVIVEPATVQLKPGESRQLRAIAEYSNGQTRDVTDSAAFQSNDRAVTAVSDDGILQAGEIPGETAIMARYMNHIAVSAITIPLPGEVPSAVYDALPRDNAIDGLVWEKLKLLGMLPSDVADDAKFHRRAFLRIIGKLPTPDETRGYLAEPSSNKRAILVDQLLARPEYADFWANKWADLLRPNPFRVGMKAVWMIDSWVRESFRENKPYDQFVYELLTARGSTWENGATVLYRDRPQVEEIAASTSQLFLGIRLSCAKCHHHPFEVWSQDDFYGYAAYFGRIGRKGVGLSPPISGSEEMIFTAPSGAVKHGRTGEVVAPKMLWGESPAIGENDDPREVLARWVTSPDNPYFAKVMANRVWAEMMGIGIVDPVDDLRATNPPSNEPLLDDLARDFRDNHFDIKQLIRRIALSRTFALSSTPGERNASDLRNFSRYYRQRLRAEVLADAWNDVLGTEDAYAASPPGTRAVQLWTLRTPSVFLDTFGRPDANQDPPYERTWEMTTPQILHLMNSQQLDSKLAADSSRPAKLAQSEMSNPELVEEAYLWIYGRRPTPEEADAAVAALPADIKQRRSEVVDLFWALMNTPEFYFID
ncbi:MAG: DUF1553 domain-containing protein [Planctomycetaceae bacterium]|nr:DUF1553 domain-containing protein [Planctomycetaceae bacterium]